MILHQLLPLVAFALNLTLVVMVLYRDHRSRLNQVFASVAAALGVWNLGVFFLRWTADTETAVLVEKVLHLGVILVPAFYYHFVVVFLEIAPRRRRLLAFTYALALAFLALSPTPLFMRGVAVTYWGFAPAAGPLYNVFFAYFMASILGGILELLLAYRRIDSAFRRNRAKLIILGSAISVLGGAVDIVRFGFKLERLYPLGIPANAVFALLLGVSIVRYRLVNVGVVAKRVAIFGGLLAASIPLVIALGTFAERTWELRYSLSLREDLVLAFLLAVLLTPLMRAAEGWLDRLTYRKRYGFYETLSDLRKRMGSLLDVTRLADTLVQTLVDRIPLTHGALFLFDPGTGQYQVQRLVSAGAIEGKWRPLRVDGPIIRWLRDNDILVREEIPLRRRMAEALAIAEADLEAMQVALLLPLKSEGQLIGVLALGEKLSGEIFDGEELELLRVLAGQATVALQTSQLYEQLSRTNEQLVEANTLKSQFLAQFSHELRTPLNAIIGFSKVMLKTSGGALSKEQEEDLAAIHSNGLHLLGLINDVLDFSKIESGTLELEKAPVVVEELIDECVKTTLPLIRGRNLVIRREIEPALPPVRADRTKIRQVLLNLLSNAVKFTPEGSVTVRAGARADRLVVSVQDTGVGIRAEDQPKLFRAFQQLNGGKIHLPLGGTGLGLVISKSFVELHGGEIWVESREGQGSTFSFTLPLEAVHAHEVHHG
ncbi:MAG: GAF domain-containing protein [Candidatus Rokubacteria bacterium]|nr:GAF domain-containing protein [Candidatus Rokubacteria bacterium]